MTVLHLQRALGRFERKPLRKWDRGCTMNALCWGVIALLTLIDLMLAVAALRAVGVL